jgi:hypothetical protein
LDDLVILNSLVDVDGWTFWEGTGTAILLEGPAEGAPEGLKLIIKDSEILASGYSVEMKGKAQLAIEGSELESRGGLWAEGGGRLVLDGNEISIERSSTFPVTLFLKDVEARLQGNKIWSPSWGTPMRWGFGIMIQGGEYRFIENEIRGFLIAVSLAKKANADFRENVIEENSKGIALYLPSCLGAGMTLEFRFEGMITGADNLFSYNEQDLCPPDYPWPPGFLKGSG